MQQMTFFPEIRPPKYRKLVFRLVVPGRLPSLNEILRMEEWARYKFKDKIANAFSAALRASEKDCSTRTTSSPSITSTYADTLEHCLAMRREQRRLRSIKKRLAKANPSVSSSKSGSSNVPF
jgi:hypothetical protein